MYPEDIIRVDRITFKFLWNKKWDGKCPVRIQGQVLKNGYEMGGLKAPDMSALNSAHQLTNGMSIELRKFPMTQLKVVCCVFRPANCCYACRLLVKIIFLMLKQLFPSFSFNKCLKTFIDRKRSVPVFC